MQEDLLRMSGKMITWQKNSYKVWNMYNIRRTSSQFIFLVVPPVDVTRFFRWWGIIIRDVPKEMQKGLNSLIILVAWAMET